jgi:hypothetical protein
MLYCDREITVQKKGSMYRRNPVMYGKTQLHRINMGHWVLNLILYKQGVNMCAASNCTRTGSGCKLL